MTTLRRKPVTRTTATRFRFTLSGAVPEASGGKALVVELSETENGRPMLALREKGRRDRVEIDLATLYTRSLIERSRRR